MARYGKPILKKRMGCLNAKKGHGKTNVFQKHNQGVLRDTGNKNTFEQDRLERKIRSKENIYTRPSAVL